MDGEAVPDERLRMILTACHPALAPEARIALTLRYAAGLTTAEIARLFHVAEPAMAARLTRAKQKIARAGIPYRVPGAAELPQRLTAARAVVYLVFTEGHAPTRGAAVVRPQLCDEAVRLARILHELTPEDEQTTALLALLLLTHARTPARTAADGAPILLADQDRGAWDTRKLAEGATLLDTLGERGSPYAVQARIAAEHARPAGPDWPRIADLFAELESLTPTPAVRLNRAVAVAEADGPRAGLALLDDVAQTLHATSGFHTARAELLARAGDHAAAEAAYDDALARAQNAATRTHLQRRRTELRSS